jgi:gliding motility-associated-like protein
LLLLALPFALRAQGPGNQSVRITRISDAIEGGTSAQFRVSLYYPRPANEDVTVQFTVSGTAETNTDYTLVGLSGTNTLVIPANSGEQFIYIASVNDGFIEGPETVNIELTSAQSASRTYPIDQATSTMVIVDANSVSSTPIQIITGSNGAEPSTSGSFTVKLAGVATSDWPIMVGYALSGTARHGDDYRVGTIVIPANRNSVNVTLSVEDDQVIESDEEVIISILSGSATDGGGNAFIFPPDPANNDIRVTVTDNDATPANMVLSLQKQADAAEPATNGGFSIALPTGYVAERSILLNYSLQGTATRDVDYSFTKQVIGGYTNSDVLPVMVIDDALTENTETIAMTLVEGKIGNSITFTPGNNNVSLNIADNDAVPTVTQVGIPATGYYRAGQVLNFTVRFTENVVVNTVGGTPSLPVVIGNTTVQAAYNGGTGTNTLQFSYTVQPGDNDMNGIALNPALLLNGGTIKSGSGNDALPMLNNVPSLTNVLVNTMAPTVTLSGNPPLQGSWTMTITFSEAVTGFVLNDIQVSNATLSNIATSNNITYTVLVTPAGNGSVTLLVPADAAVNIGNNGNTASNTFSYTVDAVPPEVASVAVPANGYYKAGALLNFAVAFNEDITVSDTRLSLPLTIGTSTVQAAYMSGSGSRILQFSYSILNGQMDMDGIALGNALLLNGSTVRDGAGNNAILTLKNVASTSGVLVNTAHPTVTVSTTSPLRVNAPFTISVAFNEAVTGLIASDLQVTNGSASDLQTTDNISYTATITPAASGEVSIQLPVDRAVNIGDNGNQASNTLTLTTDLTPPVITAGQSFQIRQNSAAGTAIGTILGSDASGTLQNWTITSDPSNGAFALNAASGSLTVNNTNLLNQQAGQTVTLQVRVTDGLNSSVVTPVQVTVVPVNAAPSLDPIGNVRLCATTTEQNITLTGASATEPAQTYSFRVIANQDYFDELSVSNAGVLRYRLKLGVNSGQATITVTIQDNGGTANGGVDTLRRSFTVTILSLPEITIQSDKGITVSKGDIVRLTATGGTGYQWDNAPGIVSGEQTATLSIRPQQNATYRVVVHNAAGCSRDGNITISVVEDFKVDATNIITPNGDGKNDRWIVRNIDSYPNNEVKIFDRAGRLVYQRRNYNNEWDGRLNGQPLAEGAYYYILTINNGARTAKGAITIIRDRY